MHDQTFDWAYFQSIAAYNCRLLQSDSLYLPAGAASVEEVLRQDTPNSNSWRYCNRGQSSTHTLTALTRRTRTACARAHARHTHTHTHTHTPINRLHYSTEHIHALITDTFCHLVEKREGLYACRNRCIKRISAVSRTRVFFSFPVIVAFSVNLRKLPTFILVLLMTTLKV